MKHSSVICLLGLWLVCAFIVVHGADDTKPALVYFTEIKLSVRDQSKDKSEVVTYKREQITNKTTADGDIVTVNFNALPSKDSTLKPTAFTIELVLNKTNRYWKLSDAKMTLKAPELNFDKIKLLSTIPLDVPVGLSFHCSRFGPLYPAIKSGESNHTINIDIKGFQIQAFNADNSKFSPAYECVGFFTIGIWTGIFVTFFLASIMTWGISMIMNIKTMDRFDDPKGKPISLGGSD